MGEPMTKAKTLSLAAGLALAVAMNAPSEAQYMSSPYPVIIVPPPPAQYPIVPKPTRERARPPKSAAPPPDSSPPNRGNCYHGRTNDCP
jgi:hypothetical protein